MNYARRTLLSISLLVASSHVVATPIANGSSVIGVISSPSDRHQYTFHAEPGDTIAVSMADLDGSAQNVAGDLYPYVEVLSPSGRRLGAGSNTLVASRFHMVATEGGVLTLFL